MFHWQYRREQLGALRWLLATASCGEILSYLGSINKSTGSSSKATTVGKSSRRAPDKEMFVLARDGNFGQFLKGWFQL
ncbi:hypothetical protein B0T25DRAFT_205550 [Lasiosphaeria hispida]|uniref:Uncharacterized protein n=1 Tax=Lasiosphaeria hispida TaxID=260671 RepID=A0AAJ0MEI1_9PEZI|nr:hypothetical protein B0T25DRAFT_205550 [Lasiosphaeria hispida]